MKITFLGDIMIEPPVLKAAKRPGGQYDFREVFQYTKPMLAQADYVVGNLETPLAGPEAKYTGSHYSFNAPDSYADAVKDAGIDLVSTTNNHTFDRGYDGLVRTIQVLDEKGIGHTGTFLPGSQRPEAYYFQVGGTKIALIAYTYGTNYGGSGGKYLAEGQWAGTVNLLRHQSITGYLPGVVREKDWVDKLFKKMKGEPRGRIKKFLGMCHTYARADDRLDKEAAEPYMAQVREDIRKAKEKADLVIYYPHTGGQFNQKPGYFSQYTVEQGLQAGADAVIVSHSHCPQLAKWEGGVPVVNSLGNFNMSPRSSLAIPENLTHYGLAVHLYIEDKKIQRMTYTPLLNYEKRGGQVSAYPVADLYGTLQSTKAKTRLEKDMRKLYGVVTGKVLEDPVIREEYEITE